MKMRSPTMLLLLLLFASGGAALLVPDNIVSFMHILYSTIPVIRKGTDSRLGFGFRFGPHADAQVVLELGPQRRTEPLTIVTTQAPTVYDSKRHVNLDDADDALLLHGERPLAEVADNHLQEQRGRSRALGGAPAVADATGGGGGGEWLSRWRSGWSAPATAPEHHPHRMGRGGMRIALAPTTSTVSAYTSTTTVSVSTSTTARAVKQQQQTGSGGAPRPARANPTATSSSRAPATSSRAPAAPTASAPTAHLRGVMAALTSSRSPPRTASPPRQPRQQGVILQVLRQLWQAGTRAVVRA